MQPNTGYTTQLEEDIEIMVSRIADAPVSLVIRIPSTKALCNFEDMPVDLILRYAPKVYEFAKSLNDAALTPEHPHKSDNLSSPVL